MCLSLELLLLKFFSTTLFFYKTPNKQHGVVYDFKFKFVSVPGCCPASAISKRHSEWKPTINITSMSVKISILWMFFKDIIYPGRMLNHRIDLLMYIICVVTMQKMYFIEAKLFIVFLTISMENIVYFIFHNKDKIRQFHKAHLLPIWTISSHFSGTLYKFS